MKIANTEKKIQKTSNKKHKKTQNTKSKQQKTQKNTKKHEKQTTKNAKTPKVALKKKKRKKKNTSHRGTLMFLHFREERRKVRLSCASRGSLHLISSLDLCSLELACFIRGGGGGGRLGEQQDGRDRQIDPRNLVGAKQMARSQAARKKKARR